MFTSLEKKTGIQAIVVMLPSIGDEDIFEFSQKLFRHWGIGEKKRNNGLLVVYVSDQRTIRFHTGYGIEGSLPDAKCPGAWESKGQVLDHQRWPLARGWHQLLLPTCEPHLHDTQICNPWDRVTF